MKTRSENPAMQADIDARWVKFAEKLDTGCHIESAILVDDVIFYVISKQVE